MAEKKASGGSEGYLLAEHEKKKVIKAVEDGDCAPLRKLIKNKWNLNQTLDEHRQTALHLAAGEGRTEVVRVLLEGGADVDVRDVEGETPLHWAARRGHTDTVKVMLANKASVDVRDKVLGRTPLYWAALRGHTDTVKLLLANKASVDVRDVMLGRTPLYMAAEWGRTDTVKVLLANKASVDVRSKLGDTPLHTASEHGHTEVVKLLCRESGCDVNTVNERGETLLHLACARGQLDVVKLLIEEDGDVTAVNQKGETAYDVCGREGYVDKSTVENIKEFLQEHLFRLESDAPPTATIDGTAGGVMLYKGVQIRVPPNAISGDINIEFVDQSLSAREVHDKTKGRAILHCQVICVDSTDEDATFSEPVKIRVPLRTMFEKVNDQQIDSEDLRILHEKDGEVTDITEDCNVRLKWGEIAFYCKTCSMVNIAWLADFTSRIPTDVFTTIKHILEASYMCTISPYIKYRQDGGLTVQLFCHGVDVKRTDGIEHECTSYKMRLINSVTLLFEVDCWSIKDEEKTQIYSRKFKLERDHCDRACTVYSMIRTGVRALVADKVQLCVKELIYKETLMDRSVKVHEESASGTPSAIILTPNTTDPRGIADIHKLIPTISFDGSHAVYRRKSDQKVATTADPGGIADIDRQISTISLDRSHAFYRQKSDQKVATTAEPDVSGDIERQISDIYDDADEFEYSYRTGQKQGTMAGLKIDAGSSVQFPSGKVTEKEASKSSTSNTEYKFDRHRRHDLSEKANATIDGATGGVILWKEVQLRVPPNAVSGHIKIDFVNQPLLARAVHDKTKGRANLHCQGICVTCTDKNAILSDPAEIRVTLGTMLEKASDQRLNSEDFRILREKDGDLTDVTEECNVRLHGEEVIFYLKTFSGLNFARVADFASSIVTSVSSVFTTIKSLFKTSYMCKICPYIIGGQDEGLIVKLYCHGEQVECSGGLEHECIYGSEKHRFPNEVTLWFEIECRCIENGNETTVPSTKDFKLYRSVCESTGKPFSKVMPGVKALVAGQVQLYLYALNYPDKLLNMSLAVHEVSAVGKAPATRTTSNTTGLRDSARKLHRELLREVVGSLIDSDFKRLKAECKDWIEPAQLEKITDTLELLDEFEKREIIKCGEYRNLIDMLGVLDLNQLKGRVEGLSRAINALGVDLPSTDASPNLT